MNWTENLLFGIVVFLFALKPGPGVVFFTSLSLAEGMKAALITAIGTDLGHFTITLLMMTGLSAGKVPDEVLITLRIAAAIYVCYVGVQHLFYKQLDEGANSPAKRSISVFRLIGRGIVWTIANPLNLAFYASLAPILSINLHEASLSHSVIIASIAAAGFFLAQLFYITFARSFYDYFVHRGDPRLVFKVSGVGLIGLALFLAALALFN